MKYAAQTGCILVLLVLSMSSRSQSLVTYGTSSVSKDEFLRAFVKNNNEQRNSEKAIRDYLELYIRFKLKVKAAYDLKLDTLPNQKAELTDFRRQIAEGFLNDEASLNKLINEAFLRSQKDIHLAHIFIATGTASPMATPDTLKAWKLASAAYDELKKGADFENVAVKYSSDPSVHTNRGDIGYITAFTLPYGLENLAYTTPVGKFTTLYRSNAGYHIFKNLGERKAVGKMKAAQILLAYPPGSVNNELRAAVKSRADSIYNALQAGASFEQLATRYGNNNTNYAVNGEMPEFGVGNFEDGFESSVFSLPKDNTISKPIATSAGYHIVKRLQQFPVNTDPANDSAMSALKQQVLQDARIEVSRKYMLQKIQHVTGFKKSVINEKNLWAYADSSQHGIKPSTVAGISNKTLLFSFPDKNIYVGDWIEILRSPDNNANNVHGEIFSRLLDEFEQTVARNYYLDHLEKYDPDFAAQVKEFKEGNLLFEVMQRNIWDKASADSIGLKRFFESNKAKYWWEPSVEAIIFNCVDSSTAYTIKAAIQKNKDWRNVIAPFGASVLADSGRFELTQLPLDLKQLHKAGMLTEPLKNGSDNNISFLYIVNEHTERSVRSFEDAKGFVLSDYQASLEEKWIADLKKKYPVKINDSVLKSLWK